MTFSNSHCSLSISKLNLVSYGRPRMDFTPILQFLFSVILSNLMKPSNWLTGISDDADYVTVYSEGKFMRKNMKEQNKRFLQLLTLLSQHFWESEPSVSWNLWWCFLSSWHITTFAYPLTCTLPSELQDIIEKLTKVHLLKICISISYCKV